MRVPLWAWTVLLLTTMAFLAACLAGTIWDTWIHPPDEPRRVLLLSWGAMDISAGQLVVAVAIRRTQAADQEK